MKQLGIILVLVSLLGGCSYKQLQVPDSRELAFPKVAVQQRLISQAVDSSVAKLGLSKIPLKDKKVRVRIAGVYPPSETEVLDYIRVQVERELMRAGAIIVMEPTEPAAEPAAANNLAALSTSATTLHGDDELVITVAVKEAGIDTTAIRDYDVLKALLQVIPIPVCLVGCGAAGFVAGTVIRGGLSQDSLIWGLPSALAGALVGGLGSAVWALIDPPLHIIYELRGVSTVSYYATVEHLLYEGTATGDAILKVDDQERDGPMLMLPPTLVRPGEEGAKELIGGRGGMMF